METLLEEGYAGLTYTKVAVRAGENKSLISYYFGSKQGLVGAVADEVGNRITAAVVTELGEPQSVDGIARGMINGIWKVMEEDKRVARLYFDLSSVSVVDPEIRLALRDVKDRWRDVVATDLEIVGVAPGRIPALAGFLTAGVQGLAIERLAAERTDEIALVDESCDVFIRAVGLLAD